MLTMKIQWGLWNQMFQYAFIRALALKHRSKFRLNIFDYTTYFRPFELDILNIKKNYASFLQVPFYELLISKNKYLNHVFYKVKKVFIKFNVCHYIDNAVLFDKKFINIKAWYIEGNFQSEKYFKNYADEIRNDFQFVNKPSQKNQELIKNITNTNSISIHIRRWDYITNASVNNFHGICDISYYTNAIKYIQKNIISPVFFIFSDDMDWVKEKFKNMDNCYYIDRNTWKNSYEDMRLMSLCKHNIIANSSFSRWWAWLNKNKNKIVIWPNKWFNNTEYDTSDILPSEWFRM